MTSDDDPRAPPSFVVVGASGSTGFVDIAELLARLPASLAAVVLVVLHRPSDRVSQLRDILARRSRLPVVIPGDDDTYRAGTCYVGEPDAHLSLAARSRVKLVEGAGNRYRNRTVDLLFASVARHAEGRVIGIVLSGALDDGSAGLAAIRDAGGVTMVLGVRGTPADGMPEHADGLGGPVDFIGSVESIAQQVEARFG